MLMPSVDQPYEGLVNSGISALKKKPVAPWLLPSVPDSETNVDPPQGIAPPSTPGTSPQLPVGNGIMPAPGAQPWTPPTPWTPPPPARELFGAGHPGDGGGSPDSISSPVARNPAAGATPANNSGLAQLIQQFLQQNQPKAGPAPENPTGQAPDLSKVSRETFGPGNDLRSNVVGGTQRQYAPVAPGAARGQILNDRTYSAVAPGAARAAINPAAARAAINPAASIRGPVAPGTARGQILNDRTYSAVAPGARRGAIRDTGQYRNIAATDPNREGRTSRLAEQYSSFLRTPELQALDVNADPRLQAARSRTDAAAGAVGSVDRRKIAQDLLNSFEKTSAEQVRNDYRSVGQNASSLGRLGMGQTAQDVQEVGRKHLTDREALRTDLAARTAEGEIGDQFNKADLFRGLEGDVYGQGTADRDYRTGISRENRDAEERARTGGLGFGGELADRSIGDEANIRDEARGERGFRYGVDQGKLDRRTSERNYADAFDANARGEARGERGFQYGVDQGNLDRATSERNYADRFDADARGEARGERDYADSAEARQREELRGERGYADSAEARQREELRGERGYADSSEARAREEARGERGFQYGVDQGNLDRSTSERDYADAFDANARGEARGERAFQYGADQDYDAGLRGERGYQNAMAETATDRAIQQTQLEEALRSGQFQRGIQLGQYGQQQNPALAQLSEALEGQGGGDMEGILALLRQFGLSSGSA